MQGISVIIAAHNEASVIQNTLRSILASKLDRRLQIIVVANGCSDDTADLARAVGGPVEVIETPKGNKIHALNLGDRAAVYFPRVYLDADVELSDNALQLVANALEQPGCHLAAPRPQHVYEGNNFFLAGYYKVWRSLPHVRNAIMGSGFYAMSEELRSRFDEFPAITADDKFVRNLARPEERRVVEGCYVRVRLPVTLANLLKVKTRWTYGNLELAETHPELNVNDQHPHQGAMRFLLMRPWLWIHLPVFAFVYIYTHRAAHKRWVDRQSAWERDSSTRIAEKVA